MAYLGIFPSLLAYICWNHGVALAGAAVAGIFTNLVPALAAVGAVLFLGERFALFHLVGMLVLGLGVVLVTRGERRPRTH
jgi:drug/metabolite transporter (DMT)-like permease